MLEPVADCAAEPVEVPDEVPPEVPSEVPEDPPEPPVSVWPDSGVVALEPEEPVSSWPDPDEEPLLVPVPPPVPSCDDEEDES